MEKYNIIYADPAWKYNARSNKNTKFGQGVDGHYPTMTMSEIKALPIPDLAADNCALCMWCTFPYLDEQIKLFKHWGFDYKTVLINWTKLNPKGYITPKDDPNYSLDKQYHLYKGLYHSVFFGIGYYAKSNPEVCLLGVKGKMKPVSNNVSSVIISPRREHSRKPDEARERIVELFGDIPRIEMFARCKPQGWSVYGNQVDKFTA